MTQNDTTGELHLIPLIDYIDEQDLEYDNKTCDANF